MSAQPLAAKFKIKTREVIPQYANDFNALITDDMTANQIDSAAFHQSEYLGGVAAVILALIEKDDHTRSAAIQQQSNNNGISISSR